LCENNPYLCPTCNQKQPSKDKFDRHKGPCASKKRKSKELSTGSQTPVTEVKTCARGHVLAARQKTCHQCTKFSKAQCSVCGKVLPKTGPCPCQFNPTFGGPTPVGAAILAMGQPTGRQLTAPPTTEARQPDLYDRQLTSYLLKDSAAFRDNVVEKLYNLLDNQTQGTKGRSSESNASSSSPATFPPLCTICQKVPTLRCPQCALFYCDECSTRRHSKGKFSTHKVTSALCEEDDCGKVAVVSVMIVGCATAICAVPPCT
jgi:hypothetical protein